MIDACGSKPREMRDLEVTGEGRPAMLSESPAPSGEPSARLPHVPGGDAITPTDIVRKIFDNVSFPVLLIDRDYKIVEANRAALSHVSPSGPNVVGQPCFRMTHNSEEPCWHAEGVTCPVKEAFESRKRVHTIHRHSVGDQIVIEEIVATPIEDDTGEIEYVVEEFRDIAELLELREGILPICASCKKIRSVKGSWHRIEEYIHDHTGADFSHSLCPECFRKRFPE